MPLRQPSDSTFGLKDEATARERVLAALADGPKCINELLPLDRTMDSVAFVRALEGEAAVAIDPDRFPDEYVPGNPMVVRLPDDERPWPGWARWNL